jgi:signal peptidase II
VRGGAELIMQKKYAIFGIVTALTVALDQWSKWWARSGALDRTREVVAGYWEFMLSHNTKGAFGFNIPGGRWAFVVFGVVALVFIVNYLRKDEAGRMRVLIPLALIAGGAVGNIYDRIALGPVTDFIHWHIKQSFNWPVFNIADAALVVGVLALVLFGPRKKKQKDAQSAEATR